MDKHSFKNYVILGLVGISTKAEKVMSNFEKDPPASP